MNALATALPPRMQRKIRPTGDCWIWTGALNSKGYACIAVNGRSQLAHRVAYERLVAPIPAGFTIDHVKDRCQHKTCVNPAHMEPVTRAENTRRAVGAGKKYCPAGHRYAGDNLLVRIRRNGHINRECRECVQTLRDRRTVAEKNARRQAVES